MATMEKLEGSKVKLTIEIAADEFEKAVQEAYLKTRKKYSVPGFRKGHAPRKVIENAYGWIVFFDDAFDLVYPNAYEAAVQEHGITPVDRPDVSIVSVEQGAPIVFTAEVAVKPEVTLGAYKGIEVEKQEYNVTDEMVEAEIDKEREKIASTSEITDRPVANGDKINLDYSGSVDGVKFEGGTAEGQELTIGSGTFIPGFEEQLVGMEIGEDRDINLSFPEQYHAPELAGKAVVFKVKLHEIYNEKEAELNDEFAASLNFPEVQSVEDLKKYINEYLEYQVEARKADAAREKLYDQILESSSCLVSPQAVETAVNMQLQQMAASFAQQGVAMEQYLQMTGKTMDSLKDELKPVAQKQVKLEAVLDEIIRVENITVSDEEMDEQYELISQKYGQPVDVVKQVLPKAQLKPDLLRMKASQLIIDAAEIIMEESGK